MSLWKLIIPDDGKHFEDLCCELWKRKWKTNNVKHYLSQGYPQKGVDLYYQSEGDIHAIQCKCVQKLTINDISKEINLAKTFEPKLKSYTIATTIKRNDKITNYILKESSKNDFEIHIDFWQDIEAELKKSSNSDILKDFFPEVFRDEVHILNILNDAKFHLKNENYTDLEIILNTLRDLAQEFNKKARYNFHILDGEYNLLCGKYKEAGKSFLEAYSFSEDDIESKYYNALGLFYTGHKEDSRKVCYKILEQDTLNEEAYSLLILINNDILIPESLKNSSPILYNKALIKYNKGKFLDAYDLLKGVDLENNSFKLIFCATIRLNL